MSIHRTAIIAGGARLGEGVKIGPFTVIGENVEIGDGTVIGSFVHLDGWTIIGRNNIIKDHVSIGHAPQYLNYNNEKTYVVIGNNNNIGEFVTIHRGTADGIGETRVGHNNRIMSHCHIAHDCNLGNNIYMGSSTNLAGHVNIENDAWLEELVGVHQYVNIGKLAYIEFQTKVTKDVPPFIMVNGHSARVEGLNYKGMKRHGLETATIDEIVRAFNILYNSGLTIDEAVEQMDQELPTSREVEDFIRFIKKSTRGICR